VTPDAGLGLDYVLRAPAWQDWITVTTTATRTETVTVTATATVNEVNETLSFITQTVTPLPKSLTREGLPSPGVGVLVVVALAAVLARRSL
jgi:carbohydrate-binding DOMON domain-containing protein